MATVEELFCVTVWEEEEERMRKAVPGEEKQFLADGRSMQRRCEPRRERNQYAAQSFSECARAHTCKAVFVSAIRLVALLDHRLIFKVVQMTLNPVVDVFAQVGFFQVCTRKIPCRRRFSSAS